VLLLLGVFMSIYDIESLLTEISPDAPSGEDISYDQSFLNLEGELRPQGAGMVAEGDERVQEPKWGEIAAKSFDLLRRSKHLTAAVYFTLALLKTEGLTGMRDGLYLIHGLLERFWPSLYPRLDADDNDDPVERMNILSGLSPTVVDGQDPVQFRRRLAEVQLCGSRVTGTFSWRDIQIARGEVTVTGDEGASRPDPGLIHAALGETGVDELESRRQAVQQAISYVDRITTVFAERARGGASPDLSSLRRDLEKIEGLFGAFLEGGETAVAADPNIGASEGPPEDTRPSESVRVAVPGEIGSRKDALRVLEKVCQYFERNEPSSPIPLLLRRAQRLVSKSFMEIVQDLCPDALSRVEDLGGVIPAGDDD
jgi:type VI secretion system protein ImpA